MNGKASGGFLGAEQFVFSRTNPPAVRCISSLRYEDAASIRAKYYLSFHNNEREKTVVLKRVIARNEAIPSNLPINFRNYFLKLKKPRCKRYDCALN